MTFPNTWLNECLHSVKKIDLWVRSEKKCVCVSGGGLSVTEINLSREKSEDCMEESKIQNKKEGVYQELTFGHSLIN